METLAGYEGKEIYMCSQDELEKIKKSNNEKEIIKAYLNLNKTWYYQRFKPEAIRAKDMASELKPIVQRLFEKAGWETHIEERKKYNTEDDCYIHDEIGFDIAIYQVPFSGEWNVKLRDEELFNGNKLREKDETLELLKKRIGEKNILNEIKNEIDELDLKIIEAIMEKENLNEIHELKGRVFRSGSKQFKYYYNYNDVEKEAREILESGEIWKEAVQEGKTTQSLEEWIDSVIKTEGVFLIINNWDGVERTVEVDGETYYYCRIL